MTTENNFSFKFQKRYIYIELIITAITAIVLISVWSPTIYTKIAYGVIVPSAVRAATFVTFTLIMIILLGSYILKEILKIEFIITDERLIAKSPYRIKSIQFSQITSVSFVRFPLHNGFLKITSAEQNVSIPLYLEDLEEFVQSFATSLVRYGNADALDKECITSLKESSRICSTSYKRAQGAFKPIFLASTFLLFFNLFVGNNYWQLTFFNQLFWCGSSWLLPVIFYIISDQYLNHIVKHAIKMNSPLPRSESVYYYVLFYMVLIYFVSGWFFVSAIS
jgi:hypothetical protein